MAEMAPRLPGFWMWLKARFWKFAWVAKGPALERASTEEVAEVQLAARTQVAEAAVHLTSALEALNWQIGSQWLPAEAAWAAETQTRTQAMQVVTPVTMETAPLVKAEAELLKTLAVPEDLLGLDRATMEAAEDWAMEVQAPPTLVTMLGRAVAAVAATTAAAAAVRIALHPAPSAAVVAAEAPV